MESTSRRGGRVWYLNPEELPPNVDVGGVEATVRSLGKCLDSFVRGENQGAAAKSRSAESHFITGSDPYLPVPTRRRLHFHGGRDRTWGGGFRPDAFFTQQWFHIRDTYG